MVTINRFYTTPLQNSEIKSKITDYAPIARMAEDTFILWVNKNSGIDTLEKFAAAAKKKGKDWVMAGTRGLATYTNVPPGKYRLLLNATDEIGRWRSEPQSILITISPPFWKTWWFITLATVLVISGLYLFYRYRISQVRGHARA